MTNIDWGEFSFDIVSQIIEKRRVTIHFTCDNVRYSLDVFQNIDGLFEPFYLFHLQEYCHFCHEEREHDDFCDFFQKHRYELFQHLIKHPKIRLKWLHIHHI